MSELASELTDLVHQLPADVGDPPNGELPKQWTRIGELGLALVGVAEEFGGSGGCLADLVVVIRELARQGIGVPIVEASTAAYAIGAPPDGRFDTVVIDHRLAADSATLTADFGKVPYADLANRLVILGESNVMTVARSQAGFRVEAGTDIAGFPAGRLRLSGATYKVAEHGPRSADVIERLAITRSSALLGSAYGAYELTKTYLSQREQFGAPLTTVPAVASALAQMSIRIRHTQSAIDRAVAVNADPAATPLRRFSAAAGARIAAGRMATLVAQSTHQLHGAIGVTREYALHRYTKKLWAWRDADESEQQWSSRLGAKVMCGGETELWEHISA